MTEKERAKLDRAQLDELLRAEIGVALRAGLHPDEIAQVVMNTIPALVDRRQARSQLEGAYDLHQRSHPELDRSLPFETGPFDRLDRD